MKKEELEILLKQFAQAYLDVLPACGRLDPETDKYYIELADKASKIVFE